MRQLKNQLNIPLEVTSTSPATLPPWQLADFQMCFHGTCASKKSYSELEQRQKFLSHLPIHSHSAYIYTDGSKSTHGVGFGVVYGPNLSNRARGTLPSESTILTAELQAIFHFLENFPGSV